MPHGGLGQPDVLGDRRVGHAPVALQQLDDALGGVVEIRGIDSWPVCGRSWATLCRHRRSDVRIPNDFDAFLSDRTMFAQEFLVVDPRSCQYESVTERKRGWHGRTRPPDTAAGHGRGWPSLGAGSVAERVRHSGTQAGRRRVRLEGSVRPREKQLVISNWPEYIDEERQGLRLDARRLREGHRHQGRLHRRRQRQQRVLRQGRRTSSARAPPPSATCSCSPTGWPPG